MSDWKNRIHEDDRPRLGTERHLKESAGVVSTGSPPLR